MEQKMKDRIYEYRIEHGLTRTRFCAICGISRSLLYDIEHGGLDKPKNPLLCKKIEDLICKSKMITNNLYTCYFLMNRFNNKKYVGITNDINRRISNHFGSLRAGNHFNKGMQKDYDNSPVDPFVYGILEDYIPECKRTYTETKYILEMKTNNSEYGYNTYTEKRYVEALTEDGEYENISDYKQKGRPSKKILAADSARKGE